MEQRHTCHHPVGGPVPDGSGNLETSQPLGGSAVLWKGWGGEEAAGSSFSLCVFLAVVTSEPFTTPAPDGEFRAGSSHTTSITPAGPPAPAAQTPWMGHPLSICGALAQ